MRQAIKLIVNKWIKDEDSVKEFLHDCIVDLELGLGFHPDTPFEEYIFKNSAVPVLSCFTNKEARKLNKALEKCFDVCRQLDLDIYELGMEIMQPLMDKAFDTDSTTPKGPAYTLIDTNNPRKDVSVDAKTSKKISRDELAVDIFKLVMIAEGPGLTLTPEQSDKVTHFLNQERTLKFSKLEVALAKKCNELFPDL